MLINSFYHRKKKIEQHRQVREISQKNAQTRRLPHTNIHVRQQIRLKLESKGVLHFCLHIFKRPLTKRVCSVLSLRR